MGKREGQQVAYAVLELEDARDALEESGEDVSAAVKRIDDVVARLDGVASVPAGLPVADAATYLQVSEPTVREWLKRGVLSRVRDAKPVLIERESLRSVHLLLAELRERGKDRDWLSTFVDYVHDRAVIRSRTVQRGLAEMEAGDLEPA